VAPTLLSEATGSDFGFDSGLSAAVSVLEGLSLTFFGEDGGLWTFEDLWWGSEGISLEFALYKGGAANKNKFT